MSANPIPVLRVGEKVPLVTSPTIAPLASRTFIPPRGIPRSCATKPRRILGTPFAFSATSASCPWNAAFLRATAHPAFAWSGEIESESS